MSDRNDLDRILDQAIDEIAEGRPDAATERAAADRVLSMLEAEATAQAANQPSARRIRDCSDFQALIPAFLRDGLSEAKALLLQDHLGECVPCRRELKRARTEHLSTKKTSPGTSGNSLMSTWGFRAAAAAVLFVTLFGLSVQTEVFSIRAGGLVQIERLEGEAFQVTDDGTEALKVGDQIDFSDVDSIRTAKGSNAVFRMADNSLVEMNERSELAVKEQRAFWRSKGGDGRIELTRGDIIVEASDQGSGHLFVDTGDCNVAVTGTVFAVNNGMRGSRVSVIEGEVKVSYDRNQDVLHPGQQSVTSPALNRVPVEHDIAWSRDVDRHLALLKEFTQLAREIEAAVDTPALRFDTELLDMAPTETAIFIGMPNVSSTVSQAYEMLQEKIDSNDLLKQWWEESMRESNAEEDLEKVMEKIRTYGKHLGDEVAVTVSIRDGEVQSPLVLARLNRPDEFIRQVEADLAASDSGLRLITGELSAVDGPSKDEFLRVKGDYVAVAADMDRLVDFDRAVDGVSGGFTDGEFHRRLSDLYSNGVGWVVGIDIESIVAAEIAENPEGNEEMQKLGFDSLQHIIAVRKASRDWTEHRASLTFNQPRTGLASWLAEPAPMGSLDFVSPDATFAAAFVMREPVSVLDELFGYLGTASDDSLDELEAEFGIDIRNDFAAALGGEFAVALDGPLLPSPSWKLIMEVYDPVRLQSSLEWAVNQINQFAQDAGRRGFSLETQNKGGHFYYRITSLDTGIGASYLFIDGYFVAGPSVALIERALQYRKTGLNLPSSPKFTTLIPQDREVHFSAAVYENLASVLSPLTEQIGRASSLLTPEQQQTIQELGRESKPSLTLAYGEDSQIQFVNTTQRGLFSSSIGSLMRLDTLLSMQELLGRAVREHEGSGDYEDDAHPGTDDVTPNQNDSNAPVDLETISG